MWVGVVTLFPEMFRAISDYGITSRAFASGKLKLDYWNPRDYSKDKHRSVDDRPYGGGPGMLMTAGPLSEAIQAAKAQAAQQADSGEVEGAGGIVETRVMYLSPQGRTVTQQDVAMLAQRKQMILLCGRYEGIDERIITRYVDEEWSIGDFVLSGGELPAMALMDAMSRLLPGVLGHEDSAAQDSFSDGLLDCPHYTRPEVFAGLAVPRVLLSGDHAEIARWRRQQSLGRTWQRRAELIEGLSLQDEDKKLLAAYLADVDKQNDKS